MIIIIVQILMILFLWQSASAEILFETSFDSGDNWTHTQPVGSTAVCLSSCGMPDGFDAYYDGTSYCGSAGYNNFYINTGAGYPETSQSCHSGSKCATFWVEGCNPAAFDDSDGNLGFWFTESFNIYVAFWIRFESTYAYSTEGKQQKLAHVQYNASGTPWSYFGNPANLPVAVIGLYRYSGNIWLTVATRCINSYYCDGTPVYNQEYANDYDASSLGTVANVLNDGQWHHVEVRFSTNTGTTGNFNADGTITWWYDGVQQETHTNVVMNDNASAYARRGYNFVSIGGNNNLGESGEQWYSMDDVVISTTYVGPDYEIGGSDITAPTVSSASVNGSTVTVNFDETVVTTGYDSGDFNLDCTTGGNDISLSSPSGSGASRTFTAATAIVYGETCNLDYVGSTNDIEDSAGNDLVAFSNTSVTNNTPGIATVSGLSITGGSVQ